MVNNGSRAAGHPRRRCVFVLLAALMAAVLPAPPVLAADGNVSNIANAINDANAPLQQKAQLQLRFNSELLAQLGLRLVDASGRAGARETRDLTLATPSPVAAHWRGASLQAWAGGEWRADAGFALADRRGTIVFDYRHLVLRPRAGSVIVDLIGSDGSSDFQLDSLMAIAAADRRALSVLSLDLRLGAAAARRLGNEALAGVSIADGSGQLGVDLRGDTPPSSCAVPHWPGSDGGAYVADIQLDDIDVQMMRCGEPGCAGAACSCDGPGGTDAAVVLAPNAQLSNTNDDNGGQPCTPQDPCSADVPWNAKFSPPRPPHGNDQHAFLIWNLYRLDPDGSIAQIGRSGIKHAFIALNLACDCGDPQILGRGCGDIYSTNNNDNTNALSPRSEIAPEQGRWGRCGALEDDEVVAPNTDYGGCDGVRDASGNTAWSHRLTVRETQLDPARHPGSRYLFEAWYLVRDDINIFNSMGHIEVEPQWNGVWQLPRVEGSGFLRGPALELWTAPAGAGIQQTSDTATDSRGHLRLATRVRPLPGGRWRYDYALMNFDFAESLLQGAEPNPRLLSSDAISAAGVTLPGDARILAHLSDDGDTDPGNDWTMQQTAQTLRWQTPGADLGWGRLLRFAVIADAAPVEGSLQTWLGNGAARSGPQLDTLVPGKRDGDQLFADGLEPMFEAR